MSTWWSRLVEAAEVDGSPSAPARASPKAKASGRKLGRPKGSLGVSRLDGKEDDIPFTSALPLQLHEHPRSQAPLGGTPTGEGGGREWGKTC